MLFNSYVFIFLFLPLTLILYYGLNYGKKEKEAKWALIIASLVFYAYFDIRYLPVILASICFNYGCSKGILHFGYEKTKKKILTLGILGNVGLLFYVKYRNFFLENINALWGTDFTIEKLLLPLGISFFTFQQIAYLVDSYKGETKGYCFTDYALFVTFFPKLSMGPIVLHEAFIPELQKPKHKRWNSLALSEGIWWFSIGLSKKVLLADTLAKGGDVLAVSLLYTLQLYFDFSGYCDMAAGISKMFQISLPQNFNSPYKATSITEFWNRWHMTLSGFLQKYIYFPLGGSRKGTVRSIINILIVFLVSGIWHGAAWTFIVWGMLHGIARVLHKLFQKTWDGVPKIIRWFATFGFVNFTWIFFRAENLTQAGRLFRKLIFSFSPKLESGLLQQFDILEFTYIEEHVGVLLNIAKTYPQLHMLFILLIGLVIALFGRNLYEKEFKPTIKNALLSMILLVWCVMSFSGVSSFLYFNF